jgi:hypothetical protein
MNSQRATSHHRLITKIRAQAFVFVGCCWLAATVYLMARNVSLRETPLGAVAKILDRLPTVIGNPIFILLWLAFLFGWTFPIGSGAWKLLRRPFPK